MSPSTKLTLITAATVLLTIGGGEAAPTNNATSNEVDCEKETALYDQRQNGSENVRVNVKDVFLVWAPEGNSGGLDSDFLDYPNEEVPQKPSGVEKPTSIIDILNSFQELAASSSSMPPTINTTEAAVSTPSSTTTETQNTVAAKAKRCKVQRKKLVIIVASRTRPPNSKRQTHFEMQHIFRWWKLFLICFCTIPCFRSKSGVILALLKRRHHGNE